MIKFIWQNYVNLDCRQFKKIRNQYYWYGFDLHFYKNRISCILRVWVNKSVAFWIPHLVTWKATPLSSINIQHLTTKNFKQALLFSSCLTDIESRPPRENGKSEFHLLIKNNFLYKNLSILPKIGLNNTMENRHYQFQCLKRGLRNLVKVGQARVTVNVVNAQLRSLHPKHLQSLLNGLVVSIFE